jgi:WD40 repeat protein
MHLHPVIWTVIYVAGAWLGAEFAKGMFGEAGKSTWTALKPLITKSFRRKPMEASASSSTTLMEASAQPSIALDMVERSFANQQKREAIVGACEESIDLRSQAGTRKTNIDPFATVPPLPPCFIPRPELTDPLIRSLLSGATNVALTAVEGMGGIGKTIVAIELCHDSEVRQAFHDGIIWFSVGKEPDLSFEEMMKTMANNLNQEFRSYSQAAYRTLLREKVLLVVLDDVWTLDTVEPFRLNVGRSRILYTTRNKDLAASMDAQNYEIDVLNDQQARHFLSIRSGRNNFLMPEPYATEILSHCKGLLLGLAMIGGALKDKPDQEWSYLCEDLRKAQLKRIGVHASGYAYSSLYASIAASVDALDLVSKTRYLELAILLEDMAVPNSILRILWGGTEREVHRTMEMFVQRSLASWDAEGNMRLHDFQLDFVRNEHANRDALTLQNGALLRSIHVVRNSPEQFSSQMIGRLMVHKHVPDIASFLERIATNSSRPQLWPLRAALVQAGEPVVRILKGHTGEINGVAITVDGRRAISSSADWTLRVWDLDEIEPPVVLHGHTDSVRGVALTADGKLAVSCSADGTLRVWNLESKRPPLIVETQAKINAVAIAADGRRMAWCLTSGLVGVWDIGSPYPTRLLKGHVGPANSIALSSNGRYAISGSSDKTALVWDLDSNGTPRALRGHTNSVMAVAISADGKRAMTGSVDKTVRIWELNPLKLIGYSRPLVLEGHTHSVMAVAMSADGTRGISGSSDNTVRLWELQQGTVSRSFRGHSNLVSTVALSGDKVRALSGSWDTTLRVWDLERIDLTDTSQEHTSAINAIALTSDGRRAVSASSDKTLRLWNLDGDFSSHILTTQSAALTAVVLTSDGARAISTYGLNPFVCNIESGHTRELNRYRLNAKYLAIAADDQRLVSDGGSSQSLQVWNLDVDDKPHDLTGHTAIISAIALSTDGRHAITGSGDKKVGIWDLSAMQGRFLSGHNDSVTAVAIFPGGQCAVSGSDDHTLRIWDLLEDVTVSNVLSGHSASIRAIAVSAKSPYIVSGSDDSTIRVWDRRTLSCVCVFTCDAPVLACATNGTRIIAGDRSGRFYVFHWQE